MPPIYERDHETVIAAATATRQSPHARSVVYRRGRTHQREASSQPRIGRPVFAGYRAAACREAAAGAAWDDRQALGLGPACSLQNGRVAPLAATFAPAMARHGGCCRPSIGLASSGTRSRPLAELEGFFFPQLVDRTQ